MIRVVEAFSGIGAQAKALKNIGADYEIVSTIEWDINAICAYDLIHNGEQHIEEYATLSKKELLEKLSEYSLSCDGKKPMAKNALNHYPIEMLKRLLYAIQRTKNLVSIKDVKAESLPENVDLLTYSFPCQDLSICGAWHGNKSGINRDANNRSGMLWEVERILKEYIENEKALPNFLLMENVSNILSETHRHNFNEWKSYLESIGYVNKVYTLNAINFGIPQNRVRTYMLSVLVNSEEEKNVVSDYFKENDLEITQNSEPYQLRPLAEFLKTDYTIQQYSEEARKSNPNFTPSRQKIFNDNPIIFDGTKVLCNSIKTITTRQDRNPNSGIVSYNGQDKKAPYRYLTPRECFLLMGFSEEDFQKIADSNFKYRNNRDFFSTEKLIKMAGNSIVVNVLEAIFKQVVYINDNLI